MVSAYLADALRDPTAELNDLYTKSSLSADFPSEVARHFSAVFASDDAFREILTLDAYNPPSSHPDRGLVRFRAMVQDTSPSSEMYLRKTQSGTLGGWGLHTDEEGSGSQIDYGDLRECTVVWAVNVPGESAWCRDELDGKVAAEASVPSYTSTRSYKHPEPDSKHVGVQVKIYDTAGGETLRSTDLVTFVGILTNEFLDDSGEVGPEVPTIHVLFTRKHETTVIARPYPAAARSEGEALAQTREKLIQWIANQSLGGDREAAEWVLLACISRVQSRNPPILPPTLTIARFPPPPSSVDTQDTNPSSISTSAPALSYILSHLLPITRTLPLSLDVLNKSPFAPESKNEDLHSGALQLPQGSVLLVTEHGIQEGKLVERGLSNISTLQEVMSSQTLAYHFPFSQFSFPTDIGCIVLTEGKKSAFFRTDIIVPLTPDAASSSLYTPAENVQMPSAADMAAFRDLVVGARGGKVAVREPSSEYIQQDFVRDRQQNPEITSEDLIRRMTIAKLYALSLHEAELTVDVWDRAKAFDERRRARLT
ncbi:hypothetical protein BDW22DRAFT_1486089 [Trametopsis cervina]|nr:hypothetical protein BDW22DRAFT_1486089 [Trametopsis cervina]